MLCFHSYKKVGLIICLDFVWCKEILFARVLVKYISRECSSEIICASDPQKLALTSPTSGHRSVGIVRARTQATELVLVVNFERGF
jgi:hypothetical protein